MATGTTAKKALPYPVATETPDVPRDIKALADKLEALMARLSLAPSTDANAITVTGAYLLDVATNVPVATSGWYLVVTSYDDTNVMQLATQAYVTNGPTYKRIRFSGTWGPWLVVDGSVAGIVTPPVPGAVPGGASVAVTFPVGAFSAAPVVVVTAESAAAAPGFAMVANPTASGFSAYWWQTAGAAAARPMHWIARKAG